LPEYWSEMQKKKLILWEYESWIWELERCRHINNHRTIKIQISKL
jgi:hypothetical protein